MGLATCAQVGTTTTWGRKKRKPGGLESNLRWPGGQASGTNQKRGTNQSECGRAGGGGERGACDRVWCGHRAHTPSSGGGHGDRQVGGRVSGFPGHRSLRGAPICAPQDRAAAGRRHDKSAFRKQRGMGAGEGGEEDTWGCPHTWGQWAEGALGRVLANWRGAGLASPGVRQTQGRLQDGGSKVRKQGRAGRAWVRHSNSPVGTVRRDDGGKEASIRA